VRFHAPPEDLRRYFTTFYVAAFTTNGSTHVEDLLQPEWANLRIFDSNPPISWFGNDEPLVGTTFTATGPSSRSCHFRIGTSRLWGIGLLPLGWARFVGCEASDHANLIADGHKHPTFTRFAPLADTLFGPEPDEAGELERIISFFRQAPVHNLADEERILAIHAALIDPEVETVAQIIERAGISQRTLERLCKRQFGFPPKLLLRRQRFMRSLAKFMLDPSLKWIGAIDSQYHDQAQFVRDFHEFIGTTPRDYAATPHPVLEKFMAERARVHGAAVQTLDRPEGTGG
jgi:AraC-like DNA-binding protein